jgi:protein-S-isoprenylcysteine O-methyltransferase Ste14
MMIACGKFFFRYRNALFPVVGALMVLDVWPIFRDERWRVGGCWIGIAVAFAGMIVRAMTVGLAYIRRGGRHKEVYAASLVQGGMFAHSRNPLYFGNILIAIGAGLVSNSLLFLIVGLPFFLFAYLAMVQAEEEYLAKKFGNEYSEYCRRVNRFIPNLSGISATLRSMQYRWQRVVVKEYVLIYELLAGITLLLIKHDLLHTGYQNSKQRVLALATVVVALTVAVVVAWRLKKTRVLTAD